MHTRYTLKSTTIPREEVLFLVDNKSPCLGSQHIGPDTFGEVRRMTFLTLLYFIYIWGFCVCKKELV